MTETKITEKEVVPNKQWVDRRTAIDDLLGIIAELTIEGNNTRKEVLQDRYGMRVEISDEMLRSVSREVQKAKLIMKNIKTTPI